MGVPLNDSVQRVSTKGGDKGQREEEKKKRYKDEGLFNFLKVELCLEGSSSPQQTSAAQWFEWKQFGWIGLRILFVCHQFAFESTHDFCSASVTLSFRKALLLCSVSYWSLVALTHESTFSIGEQWTYLSP